MVGQGYHTTFVANNINLLVILLNKWTPPMSKVTLPLEFISVKETISLMPEHVCRNLLFIHAWGSCNSTSATFGQGKKTS